MALQLEPGQRGKNHLLYGGYRYCAKKVIGDTTSWECCHRKSRHCLGKFVTTNDEVTNFNGEHNHSPSIGSNGAFKRIAEIKRKAIETNDRPVNIIADVLDGVEEGVITHMPVARSLSRMVRKTRQANGRNDRLPTSLVDLVIPDYLKTATTGENFLLHDSGPGPQRILVFTTERDLNVLAENRDWYMDGTFTTCPFPFHQIYSIHGFRLCSSLPTVFALLPNKTEGTYARLASVLKELKVGLAPNSIMTDFEYAAINAFRQVFPETEIRGCFFHFQQCLWRQIQGIRSILDRYRSSAEFALLMRYFPALAFVPLDNVRPYYVILKTYIANQDIDGVQAFIQYFEETWVGTPPRRGQWRPPRFNLSVWNAHDAVLQDQHRTNNNLEGWHTRFETMTGQSHPTLWRCIESFIKEQNMTRLRSIQFLAGNNPPPSKKRYRLLDDRIKTVVNDFNNRSAIDYLRSIAHSLAYV